MLLLGDRTVKCSLGDHQHAGSPPCGDRTDMAGWLTDVFTGLPAVFIVVLDALPLVGDWLTDHVPFWDEVTDFYDWLFSHAS